MKSRDVMLASLAAGMVVLWLAISPAPIGAASLIGGWEFVAWCTPCNGAGTEDCSLGGGGSYGCNSGPANVCFVSSPAAASGACIPLGGNPCTGPYPCYVGVNTGCG